MGKLSKNPVFIASLFHDDMTGDGYHLIIILLFNEESSSQSSSDGNSVTGK